MKFVPKSRILRNTFKKDVAGRKSAQFLDIPSGVKSNPKNKSGGNPPRRIKVRNFLYHEDPQSYMKMNPENLHSENSSTSQPGDRWTVSSILQKASSYLTKLAQNDYKPDLDTINSNSEENLDDSLSQEEI